MTVSISGSLGLTKTYGLPSTLHEVLQTAMGNALGDQVNGILLGAASNEADQVPVTASRGNVLHSADFIQQVCLVMVVC